jgi:hypothetical protein
MENDSQKEILKGLGDLQREIVKLRSEYKKLSKKIEQIEFQGLQEQIIHLHDTLLETQREVARLYVLYHGNTLMGAAEYQKPKESDHFIAQLRASSGCAQAKIETSANPRVVAEEFMKKAYEDAEKLGIKLVLI